MVRGTVIDEAGKGLVNVTIRVKEDAIRCAVNDPSGTITIKALAGETPAFSYFGYKDQRAGGSHGT